MCPGGGSVGSVLVKQHGSLSWHTQYPSNIDRCRCRVPAILTLEELLQKALGASWTASLAKLASSGSL